jgi:DNA polymerase III delta subunit
LINKKELARASGTIVIYNEGEINKNFLKNLPEGTKIEEFKLPKLIWNFLENIRPANGEKIIRDFHRIIENEPPELVFSLIAKQFHDLYRVKISPNSRNFPLWKIGKLKSQAKYFSLEELKALIAKLAEIDIEVKTGRAELAPSLDVLFLKRLE